MGSTSKEKKRLLHKVEAEQAISSMPYNHTAAVDNGK